MTRDFDGSIATGIDHPTLDENDGREVLGVKSATKQQLSSGGRLCRCKTDHVVALVGENKTDATSAQVADPIK